MPHRNLLAAFLEGQGRDGLRRTLQHEAFHQFAFNTISPNLPVWLNEGLAQMFEEGIWTGNSFWIGQAPPRRIRQLQADMANQKIVDFQAPARMTPEQWAANLTGDHDLGATQYNQSWAMVYFLVQAKGADGKEKFRGRLLNMLRLLHDGKDGDEAFREAFSDNITGFQDRFTEWAGGPAANRRGHHDRAAERAGRPALGAGQARQEVPRHVPVQAVGHHRRLPHALLQGRPGVGHRPQPRIYFADIAGQAPGARQSVPRIATPSAPLPDIVCRCPSYQLRTRFYQTDGKIEHEVLVESPTVAKHGSGSSF